MCYKPYNNTVCEVLFINFVLGPKFSISAVRSEILNIYSGEFSLKP